MTIVDAAVQDPDADPFASNAEGRPDLRHAHLREAPHEIGGEDLGAVNAFHVVQLLDSVKITCREGHAEPEENAAIGSANVRGTDRDACRGQILREPRKSVRIAGIQRAVFCRSEQSGGLTEFDDDSDQAVPVGIRRRGEYGLSGSGGLLAAGEKTGDQNDPQE